MALNRYRLRHLEHEGHAGAIRASQLLNRPDRLIGLILLGNNFVNIFASAIATIIGVKLFGENGIVVATFTLTIIVLLFAEVTPKTLAAVHPERVAFPASLLLKPLLILLYPARLGYQYDYKPSSRICLAFHRKTLSQLPLIRKS